VATHDSATGQSSVFPVERSRLEEATVTIDITALETVWCSTLRGSTTTPISLRQHTA
jgi:hypothetical protein